LLDQVSLKADTPASYGVSSFNLTWILLFQKRFSNQSIYLFNLLGIILPDSQVVLISGENHLFK